jgi:prephenate dehydrogenase
MESITRYVDKIESDERRVYESVFGHALRENQQVILRVTELEKETDESVRQKAREEFHEICKEGSENRQRQGISVEEADQILEESIQAVNSRKTK